MESKREDQGREGAIPSRQQFANDLGRTLQELKVCPPPPGAIDPLSTHLHLLYRWNQQINLTGIRDFQEGIRRHAVESLEAMSLLEEFLDSGESLLVDLGSGNGYPALPLIHCYPQIRGVLVESSGRKCDFLTAAARASGVGDRVEIDHRRIKGPSDLPPETAIVTLRAFPKPAQWIPNLLTERKLRAVIVWLSRSDADSIAEELRGRGRQARVQPLKSHATGALLVSS